jgi:glutamate dehydrogenase (NAD(P)+)
MWKRYNAFLRKAPELAVEWRDAETGARGWLVINSRRGGAAGGGTRMRVGVDPREVVYLAKAMELKFSISGPAIGGAKAGIDFDPTDPRKADVLERWYRAISPYLRDCYGTGGDLNVDEVAEVIPTFSRLGLHHPQEGVVRGHYGADTGRFARIIRNLQEGVEAPVNGSLGLPGMKLTVSDMITGYGVARSVQHLYERLGRDLSGVRVLLEGFGNVGASCGLYLARAGASIVGISDARGVLLAPEGLSADEVGELVRARENKLLPASDPRVRSAGTGVRLEDVHADVLVCAAVSGSLTEERLDRLAHVGVKVIASGANHPFREVRLGSTRVAQRADRHFAILADIVANCGMARTFSYLMEDDARPDAPSIFAAVDRTIGDTLDEVLDRVDRGRGGLRPDRAPTGLLAATLDLGLDRVGAA